MAFIAHTQEELKSFNIGAGKTYSIEYPNNYDNSYCYDEDDLKVWAKNAKSKDPKILCTLFRTL